MATYIDKTMFEVTVSNSLRNQTQNVAGKFGTGTGTGFTAQDCSAGILCVQNGLLPLEGYESFNLLNGNSWYFNQAADGNAGMLGDHTGIYACNNYDVNKVSSGDLTYNLGAKTLGLGVPANERGDFTEIIIGEQYTFGAGNFSTAPGAGVATGYATIVNGRLVYSAAVPAAGSGVYFQILRTKPVNEGTTYWGVGYVLKAMRAANATAASN